MRASLCALFRAGWLTAAAVLALSGCASWDGHLHLFGYTTAPNYDRGIRTVYVPIFENASYRRGLEFDLTKAVVREIEWKTPWKVTSCREGADTELVGKIVSRMKQPTLFNNIGEIREFSTTLTVEVTWRDLRAGSSGDLLSQPKPLRPGDPAPAPTPAKGPPVMVQSLGMAIPELGQSLTTAEQDNINKLAVQIVSMMEKPW
jgi:hypothetical protein